jgi:hypothetical protein
MLVTARGRGFVLFAALAGAWLLATPARAEPIGPPRAAGQMLERGFTPFAVPVLSVEEVDAAEFDPSCKGYVSREPNYLIEVTEPVRLVINTEMTEQNYMLRQGELTLVVRSPDGSYICSDAGDVPQVVIVEPVIGQYQVWVGTYAPLVVNLQPRRIQAELRVAEAHTAGPGPADVRTPPFPRWPPPRASARTEIARDLFASDENLGDVANHLMEALRATGNSRASFYTAPGGFVMVARLERIRDDARPAAGADRFIEPRPGEAEKPDDPLSYIEALFFAPEGRYRQVMFVVTNRPVGEGTWTLTSDAAGELLSEGSPDLIGPSRTAQFDGAYRVTALIYEFRKQGSAAATVAIPGRWTANTHLIRSGLLSNLRR